jgi:hypothetical protein
MVPIAKKVNKITFHFDDETKEFHRFQEIDQSKLNWFVMESPAYEHEFKLSFTPDEMKLIHYYKQVTLDFGGDDDFGSEGDDMDFEEDEETQGTKPAPDKKAAFQAKSNKVGGKANPKGGQALINQDLANMQKIRDIGGGQYQLAGKGAGQLMLPPEAAGQMDATQAARAAEEVETAKDALRVIRPQIAELEQEVARLQTLGKDASQFMARLEGLRRAESVARAKVAKGLNIPAQANVGALSRLGYRLSAPGVAGLRTAGPMAQSAAGGAGAALNIMGGMEEEDPVAKALDYLAAGFDVASMVPQPLVKGVGTVGALGMIPVQMGYEKYLKPPKKSVMDKK